MLSAGPSVLEQAQLLTWLSKDCDRLQLMLHIAGYRRSFVAIRTCHWRRRTRLQWQSGSQPLVTAFHYKMWMTLTHHCESTQRMERCQTHWSGWRLGTASRSPQHERAKTGCFYCWNLTLYSLRLLYDILKDFKIRDVGFDGIVCDRYAYLQAAVAQLVDLAANVWSNVNVYSKMSLL